MNCFNKYIAASIGFAIRLLAICGLIYLLSPHGFLMWLLVFILIGISL